MSERKYRFVDKDILSKINHLSDTVYKYNRTIRPEAIDALPDDQLFPIVFNMLHEHRAGKPCEPHVRIMIAVPQMENGQPLPGLTERMLLDVPMDLYNALPEIAVPDTTDTKTETPVI